MNDARFDPDDYQYGPRTTVGFISKFHRNCSTELCLFTFSIAEIIEHSIDDFLKLDPDPLDDRHPARSHPHAEFGNLLKMLFRNDDFMNKLVITYLLGRDHLDLSIAAARLLLDCLPGLDANVVFSEPSDFIPQLYVWAKDSSSEILRAYAIGLLAGALEVQGNAHKYRLNNIDLMPVALRRLTELKVRYFQTIAPVLINMSFFFITNRVSLLLFSIVSSELMKFQNERKDSENCFKVPSFASLHNLENSNSTWNMVQPYVIGTHKVYPLSLTMHQRFILQYLNPTGEYQDLLNLAIEGHAMDLILEYIDLKKIHDIRLTFDALRYLTSLLVHRKFAMEFIARGGVVALLRVPRASMASVAAITALYYMSYNDDVMEKMCQLSEKVLDDVVEYALWCLEHSYESGMGSSAMFFTHGFYYKPILERFDQRDGLRKLYNYISTLTLLQEANKDKIDLTEEQHLTSSQAIRNASAAFRTFVVVSYPHANGLGFLEDHFFQLQTMMMDEDSFNEGVYLKLGLIKTLFAVVVLTHEMGHFTVFCSSHCLGTKPPIIINQSYHSYSNSFRILMEIIGGVILAEPDLRLAALKVLINCISVPEELPKVIRFYARALEKIWSTVRRYNGINVSILIRLTFPIADADQTRALACRALREFAKWDPVGQILSKLPLITANELQGEEFGIIWNITFLVS
ncbi:unnamed protein product [Haemonchus placei]|uniref:LisH domain-containing protein n=1 Tax=Haemonchus placei TaxID=6290 RepID=A0A0N4W1I0_HAEPC|nr:unnamed protein product [Haemonchus placei]